MQGESTGVRGLSLVGIAALVVCGLLGGSAAVARTPAPLPGTMPASGGLPEGPFCPQEAPGEPVPGLGTAPLPPADMQMEPWCPDPPCYYDKIKAYAVVPPPDEGDSPGNFDAPASVYLGTGSVLERVMDLRMPSNGPSWAHFRTFDSRLDSTDGANNRANGWLWQNVPRLVSANQGNYRNADLTIWLDAYTPIEFHNTGLSTWTVKDYRPFTLTHTFGEVFTLRSVLGWEYHFWDWDYASGAMGGKLCRVKDPYGHAYTLEVDGDSGEVTRMDDTDGHRATYTYFTSGANSGKLQTIKLYRAQSETNANLIGQVDYTYAGSDGDSNHGWKTGDLILVTTRERTTDDADGDLSIVRNTHYRYWKGTYNGSTNPGTDHKLKYILRPENFSRFDETYDYDTATDAQVADYANVYVEYDTNYRVKELQERGTSCGGCGSGTSVGTTTLTWYASGSTSTYNDWALHVDIDRPDGTRLIVDVK